MYSRVKKVHPMEIIGVLTYLDKQTFEHRCAYK